MKNFSRSLLAFYLLLLIKFVVFKDMDMILVGHMRFYFGGTQTGEPNWIPFQTIMTYFTCNKGLLIAGLNLVGNLLILAPIGILLSAGFPTIRRSTIFMLALGTSLCIEFIQHIFQIGIFDVDDVLLNSLGFIFGYYFYMQLPGNWYKTFTLLFAAILLGLLLYYISHSIPMNPMPTR